MKISKSKYFSQIYVNLIQHLKRDGLKLLNQKDSVLDLFPEPSDLVVYLLETYKNQKTCEPGGKNEPTL
jgi:hypothetical protein